LVVWSTVKDSGCHAQYGQGDKYYAHVYPDDLFSISFSLFSTSFHFYYICSPVSCANPTFVLGIVEMHLQLLTHAYQRKGDPGAKELKL
jgi:hypothetical protein